MNWDEVHYLELEKGIDKLEKKLSKLSVPNGYRIVLSKTTTYRAIRISSKKNIVIVKPIPMFGDPSVLKLQILRNV